MNFALRPSCASSPIGSNPYSPLVSPTSFAGLAGPLAPNYPGAPGYPGAGFLSAASFGAGSPAMAFPGMAFPGMAYPGMAYPGMAYPGMAYPGGGYGGTGYSGAGYSGTGAGNAGAASNTSGSANSNGQTGASLPILPKPREANGDDTDGDKKGTLSALGLPNTDGRLQWPGGLQNLRSREEAREARKQVDAVFQELTGNKGGVDPSVIREGIAAVNKLEGLLKLARTPCRLRTSPRRKNY